MMDGRTDGYDGRRGAQTTLERIVRDYFADPPLYPLPLFSCGFQRQRFLFLRIMQAVCKFDPYFV
jgi:hypothetical protein